jgi:hypothetical protein
MMPHGQASAVSQWESAAGARRWGPGSAITREERDAATGNPAVLRTTFVARITVRHIKNQGRLKKRNLASRFADHSEVVVTTAFWDRTRRALNHNNPHKTERGSQSHA